MRDEPNVRTPRSISFARTEDDCKEVDRLKRKLEKASVDADESASHSGKKGFVELPPITGWEEAYGQHMGGVARYG